MPARERQHPRSLRCHSFRTRCHCRAIFSVCYLFLRRNGILMCEVTGGRCYSVDLPQGGLEVPCKLIFFGASIKVQKLLQEACSSHQVLRAVYLNKIAHLNSLRRNAGLSKRIHHKKPGYKWMGLCRHFLTRRNCAMEE